MANAHESVSSLPPQLERAHRRLLEKRLLSADDDAVSVLLPGKASMLYRSRSDATPRELPLSGPSAGTAALHAQVYRLRADAGALASISTATSDALAESGVHVPIVFDEQARHIGEAWHGTDATRLDRALLGGANAGLVEGRLLVIGVTPSRMIFNAELFEKSSHAYLLARGDAPGRKTHLVPWWVRLIAGRRLRRDQANAARCHAQGREAPELTAY
jgi:hypothetical protein